VNVQRSVVEICAKMALVSLVLVFAVPQPCQAAVAITGGAAVAGEDIGCSTTGLAPAGPLTPNVLYSQANLTTQPSGSISAGTASVSWNISAAHVIANGSSKAGFPDVVGCAPVPPGAPFGFYGQQYNYGHAQFIVAITLDGNYSFSGTSGSGILGPGTYTFSGQASGGGPLNVPGFPINPGPTFSIDVSFTPSATPPPLQAYGKSLGSGCSGSCSVGNPIDVGSGNKYETLVDYHTSGPNQLTFARYYNSLALFGTLAASLGNNWRSTYDRYLSVTSSGGVAAAISAQRANGQVLRFASSAGNWVSDSDVDVQLVQTGATTWTLTDHDDTVETYSVNVFDEALLTSIQARNGYTQTLQYNTSNQLTSVVDTYGHILSLAYLGGLLQTVTTPDNLVLTYTYTAAGDGNILTSVSYSTTPTTIQTYLYENTSLPFALTGIVDEDGNRYATWSYDSNGRALSSQHAGGVDLTTVAYDDTTGNRTVTNALGQQMLYKFTTLQNVPKVTEIDRLASSTTGPATRKFTYDNNGYTASTTDWNGNLLTYVNDIHGQPTTIDEAVGTAQARVTNVTYLSNYHLPSQIVTPGLTTSFVYDTSGNLLTKTLTDTTATVVPYSTNGTSRTWAYTWSNFLLASMKGPRTDVSELTSYTYDSSGALTKVTNALNQVTQITQHTPGGLPQTLVDPNGVTTTLSYDARLRLLSRTISTNAGPLTTAHSYDAVGNLMKTTLPDGSALANTYDAAHRLIGITDLFGQSTNYALDALGDRTRIQVANGSSVVQFQHSATFDALGRILQDIGGVGQTTSYLYDLNGNALTVTDPLGHSTQEGYDALNHLIRTIDAASGITKATYDPHDRPLTIVDPNSGSTTYVYNGFGDVVQRISPDSGKTVYSYDLAGNLIQKIDATGAVTNYTYDALNRMLTTTYPADAAENVAQSYDQSGHGFGVGRLTSVTDAVGTLSRSYDERGNVLSERRVHGAVTLLTSYTYDAASRVASIIYPSGSTAAYARDVMGRVTGVTAKPAGGSAQSVLSGVAYQPFGPVNALSYGNGVAEARVFDLDNRFLQLTDTGAAPLQNLIYAYDGANNVSTVTDGVVPANTQNFSYDVLNRLASATGSYGTLGYTYTTIGNRLTQTLAGTTTMFTYAPHSNQLASIKTGTTTQTVGTTAAGNVSSFSPAFGSVTSLAYNQANRLATTGTGSTQLTQYAYDALGQRIVKVGTSTGTTMYQYDGAGHLLEEADGLGNPQVDYVYLHGRPVATIQMGKIYFLHDDRLGTPQTATDSTQTIAWMTTYQPFGQIGPLPMLIAQDLRFPGQENDPETGLYHNGFRDYVPLLGRYLQSDPIGLAGGVNTYAYVGDNPVGFTDPTGLSDLETILFKRFTKSLAKEAAKGTAESTFANECGDLTSFAFDLWDVAHNTSELVALALTARVLGPRLLVTATGLALYKLYSIGSDLEELYEKSSGAFAGESLMEPSFQSFTIDRSTGCNPRSQSCLYQ
jgi:RHS repeat-associated protein